MTETADLPQTPEVTTAPCPQDGCQDGCGECKPEGKIPAATIEQVNPSLREVTIRVPPHVTDQVLDMALGLGSMAVECLSHNGMMLIFPTAQKDAQGKVHPAIGQAQVPLMNMSDVNRILKVAKAITDANVAQMKAAQSGVPGAQVNAAIDGENLKDNIAADEAAKAQGNAGGIIIAHG